MTPADTPQTTAADIRAAFRPAIIPALPGYDASAEAETVCQAIGSNNGHGTVASALVEAYRAGYEHGRASDGYPPDAAAMPKVEQYHIGPNGEMTVTHGPLVIDTPRP